MNWYERCINIIFPSKHSYFELNKIPKSPQIPQENNIFSFFDYKSKKGRELIYYIKKHRDPLLIEKIVDYIHYELLEVISERNEMGYYLNPLVVPIPISEKRLKERGFNQCHDFAKKLAKIFEGNYRSDVLYKTRETAKQALISQRHKRKENVRNTFDIKDTQAKEIYYKDIILVDDLYTSGATIREASRILLKNKVRNIIVITIAH